MLVKKSNLQKLCNTQHNVHYEPTKSTNISTFPCVTPISDVDTIVSTVFLPILAFKVACKHKNTGKTFKDTESKYRYKSYNFVY